MTLTIQTRAIDMVILNKNIPTNQHTGNISQSNKKGRDNKSDQTQIFNHHRLSAKNHHKTFQNSKQTTKLIEISAPVFRE